METQETAAVMSMKDWIITLIITAVPLVGFVMLFVWGFSDTANLNKKNFARASLILLAVFTVIYMILAVVLFGTVMISTRS
jgi:uncharacterized membrane protein YqjE